MKKPPGPSAPTTPPNELPSVKGMAAADEQRANKIKEARKRLDKKREDILKEKT
jgi:hypothetical protein